MAIQLKDTKFGDTIVTKTNGVYSFDAAVDTTGGFSVTSGDGRVFSVDEGGAEPTPPSVFNFIALKRFAHRRLRAYTSLPSWQSSRGGQYDQQMFQISRVDFVNGSNAYYPYPSDMKFRTFTMFNGRKMLTKPVPMSSYASGERIGRIFDHSVSTKWANSFQTGGDSLTDVYDLSDATYSAPEADRPYAYNLRSTYDSGYYQATFGVHSKLNPCAIVLDLSSNPLDVTVYDKWKWYTANDTSGASAGGGQRQWIEGEVVGSVDGDTWWRLDIFNDIDMPTVNSSLAYTGSLVPRIGDVWSDLDFSARDWANGVVVDSI